MSITAANKALARAILLLTLAGHAALAASAPELGPPANVSLTLYADGQALVREERHALLARGTNRVIVRQLPAGIDTSSIRVTAPGLTLVEVRDGLSAVPPGRADSSERPEQSVANGRIANGEAVGEWSLDAAERIDGPIIVTYLVPGIRYAASLDLVLDANGQIQLDGWVSIRNGLSISLDEVRVVLVTAPARTTQRDSLEPTKIPRREVELATRVTLPAGQERRVRVLNRRTEPGAETIVIEGGRPTEHEQRLDTNQRMRQRALGIHPVWAEARRRLSREDLAAVTQALPPVTRRIYRHGSRGPELLYEDSVDPIAMSGELSVMRMSKLRARRSQLHFVDRKDAQEVEETIEIVVANDGEEVARVELLEHLFRSPNFEVLASSRELAPARGTGRGQARCALTIEPGEQAKLTYTVVYRP